jgi:hypothetical protein
MVKLALTISLVLGLGVASCTLFDEDPPDGSCEVDTDCFRAQGEVCNQMTHECEVRADAGVDAP